jgi:phage gpG-like protein
VGVSFDMEGLQGFKDRVSGLVGLDFRVELAQVLAAAALTEVSNEFRESRDPYGEAWLPLAFRSGQPLLDTGRMRASVYSTRVGVDGFTIRISANYAVYHQYGARVRPGKIGPTRGKTGYLSRAKVGRLPQRRMIPDAATGIGPIWGATFKRDAAGLVKRRLSRGAA